MNDKKIKVRIDYEGDYVDYAIIKTAYKDNFRFIENNNVELCTLEEIEFDFSKN